jgi:chromate transporter
MIEAGAQPAAEMAQRPSLAQLGVYLLYLGAAGFGGPIALAARMQRDWVEAKRWVQPDEYLEALAFSQVAPGPLAAQLAMYLGFVVRGMAGATVAAVAFVLPSLAIVVVLAVAYTRYGATAWVQRCFYGVGPVVIALIAIGAWRLAARVIQRDRSLLVIFAVVAAWTAISQRELAALFLLAGLAVLLRRHPELARKPVNACVIAAASPGFSPGTGMTLLLFFLKAGLFVFGSGLAIIPFLYAGVVQQHHWLNDRQFLDAVAVAMITPGPVVITVAFIGYLVEGIRGALLAAAGIFVPVYLMVVLIAPVFRRYAQHAYVRSFVAGVTAAAAGAIAGSAIVLAGRTVHDGTGVALGAVSVLLLTRWKLPEPLVVAAGAAVGLFSQALVAAVR